MRINRFVLDNNIWISYFITNKQQKIVGILDAYEIDIFLCDELIKGFTTVLHYPHTQKYKVNIPKAFKRNHYALFNNLSNKKLYPE